MARQVLLGGQDVPRVGFLAGRSRPPLGVLADATFTFRRARATTGPVLPPVGPLARRSGRPQRWARVAGPDYVVAGCPTSGARAQWCDAVEGATVPGRFRSPTAAPAAVRRLHGGCAPCTGFTWGIVAL
jgi:hypothetical protein